MKWFKHMTDSRNSESMIHILDELGAEGYGIWWLMVEMVAGQMDGSNKSSLSMSERKWCSKLEIRPKKLSRFLVAFAVLPEFYFNRNGKTITVDMPFLLSLRDNWTNTRGRNYEVTSKKLSNEEEGEEKRREVEDIYNKFSELKSLTNVYKTKIRPEKIEDGQLAICKLVKEDNIPPQDLERATTNYLDHCISGEIAVQFRYMMVNFFSKGYWKNFKNRIVKEAPRNMPTLNGRYDNQE